MEEDFYRFDGNIFVTKKSTRFQMHILFVLASIFNLRRNHQSFAMIKLTKI